MCERLTRCSSALFPALILSIAVCLLLAPPALAQNENERIGFSSTHVFDGGGFDENIDILNGNLNFVTPIGPTYQVNQNLSYQLKLSYNSKVWEYLIANQDDSSHTLLLGESPFGLGFTLSMGRLYQDTWTQGANTYIQWYFITPDGNRHLMGLATDSPGVSTDSSYLVPKMLPNAGAPTKVVITNGSGIRYTLDTKYDVPGPLGNDWREQNAAYGGWYVTLIEDMTSGTEQSGQYPNWIRVEYDSTIGVGKCIKTISDSTGRAINFLTARMVSSDPRSARTTEIQLPKFKVPASQTIDNSVYARYQFDYDYPAVFVPAVTMNSFDRLKRPVVRLKSILIPDGVNSPPLGFKTSFFYSGSELIRRTLPMNEQGTITTKTVDGITYDVGTRVDYHYSNYVYYDSHFASGQKRFGLGGVTRMVDSKDLYLGSEITAAATWSYNRDDFALSNYSNPLKVVVTTSSPDPVNSPLNNDTVYFFHASPTPGQFQDGSGFSDGIAPEWDDGLLYRTEIWEGAVNAGRLIRTEDRTYISDFGSKDNIRVLQATTTFNDDDSKQVVTSYDDWDGAGHWRIVSESGYGIAAPRITKTNYRKIETFDGATSVGFRTDVYDYVEVSDGNTVASRTEYEYEDSSSNHRLARLKKALNRKSVSAAPGSSVSLPLAASSGDVLTTYSYDSITGNVTQKLLESPGTQTFTINYGYATQAQGSHLKTKEFLGLAIPWKSINWERDGNTGLIQKSCDPAGFCTTYDYDALGRIKKINPPSLEYATAIKYERCSDPLNLATCSPSLHETHVRQAFNPDLLCSASANGDDCIYSEYSYDELARLVKSKKRDYLGAAVVQQTTYDAFSKILSRSEWVITNTNGEPRDVNGNAFSPTLNLVNGYPSTTYDYKDPISLGQDPLGRAWKVTTADGQISETVYYGQDSRVTVKGINGQNDRLFDATTTYSHDAFGRLVGVSSPSGRFQDNSSLLGLSAARAEYLYDVTDNLIQVDLITQSGAHQIRTFSYDASQRLLREDNPENGATLYEGYDALGNLLSKRDSANIVLSMTYDQAGRLQDVKRGSTFLSKNYYDTTETDCGANGNHPDFPKGKLTKVESYADSGVLQFTQKYCHMELNGRLSAEWSNFSPDWTNGGRGINTVYYYNNFGLRSRAIYPDDGSGRTVRDLTATYTNGFQRVLRDTPNNGTIHISDIRYNPAGGIWTIDFPGGSRDRIEPDARNRPSVIFFTGWLPASPPPPGGGGGGNGSGGGGSGGTVERQQIGYLPAKGASPYRSIGVEPSILYNSGLYLYDGAGNILRIGASRSYRYDEANRLINAYEIEANTTYTLSWIYDPYGNMVQSSTQVGGNPAAVRNFCPPGASCVLPDNRLVQMVDGGVTTNFTFDPRGNLAQDNVHVYNYDARNRLVAVDKLQGTPVLPVSQGSFVYDAAGNRVVKTVDEVSTYYVRDQQGQVLSEFRKPASSASAPAWDKDYLYAAGRLVADAENDNPHTPGGLTCTADGYGVTPTWLPSPDPDLDHYRVHFKVNQGGSNESDLFVIPPTVSVYFPPNSDARVDIQVFAVDTAGHESTGTEILSVKRNDTTPPNPAPAITTITGGDCQVSLGWSASSDDVQLLGYKLLRNGQAVSPATLIRTTSFVDLGLSNGTTYTYQVIAVDTAGNTRASTIVTATPQDTIPPAPPANLAGVPGCGTGVTAGILLTWSPNDSDDGVAQYQVFRHDNNGSYTTPLPNPNPQSTSFSDPAPAGTPPFSYVVRALDGASPPNVSAVSNEVVVRPRDVSLAIPARPWVIEAKDGHVTLRWKGKPSCAGTCGFVVHRRWNIQRDCRSYDRLGTVPFSSGQGASTDEFAFTDTSATNAVAYDYVLALTNGSGEGDFSPPALGIPLETIRDVRVCRPLAAGTPDPCVPPTACTPNTGNLCVTGPWSYRWDPPSVPSYQPVLANPFNVPQGFLKGYRVYLYHAGGADGDISWLTGSTDYGIDAGQDAEYRTTTMNDWGYCHAIKAVYKVYADGNWQTVESGYSSNFFASEFSAAERCPSNYWGTWCSLPICSVSQNPPAPSSITATSGPGVNQITLSWTRPASASLTGYYLYVNDPSDVGFSPVQRHFSAFLKDRPYLMLDSETNSVVLNDMDPAKLYTFYVVSINSDGRLSDPSPTSTPINSLAGPTGALQAPDHVRVRVWGANDYTFAYDDGSEDSRSVVRIKWNHSEPYTEVAFIVDRCVDPSNPQSCSAVPQEDWINYRDDFDRIAIVKMPAGVTSTFYRVRAVKPSTGQITASPAVAAQVVPFDSMALSPPSYIDARVASGCTPYTTLCNIELRWCPPVPEEGVTGYRVFRAGVPGGPYTAVADLTGSPLPISWVDSGLATNEQRYYYVIASMRGSEISGFSRENSAGDRYHLDPDYANFDYDSFDGGGTGWPPTGPSWLDWQLWYCSQDYVDRGRPAFEMPIDVDEDKSFVARVELPVEEGLRLTSTGSSEGGPVCREREVKQADEHEWEPESAEGKAAPYRTVGTPTDIPFKYSYYHLDHLGSPRILTDGTGLRIQGQRFLPFGEEMPIEAGMNSRKFTGHERDSETGLDYMMARYYESSVGRFLRPDTSWLDLNSSSPQSWNRYSYVLNNPINRLDPSGLAHRNFHGGWTYFLGIMAGFDPKLAGIIAAADEGVDDPPTGPFDVRNQCAWHSICETDPNRAQLALNALLAQGLPELGQLLHPLQDSFFHAGYRPPFGHFWDSLTGNSPDDLDARVELSVAAFEVTFNILKEKAAENGQGGIGLQSVFAGIGNSFFRALAVYNTEFVSYDSDHDILTVSTSPAVAYGLGRALAKQGYSVYIDGVYCEECY